MCHFFTTALAEQFNLLVYLRYVQVAHILDDAENGFAHLSGHVDRLSNNHGCQVLWCEDNDYPEYRQSLHYGERCIRSTWRQVNDEVIQFAPEHLFPELGNCPRDKRSAPDYRVHPPLGRNRFIDMTSMPDLDDTGKIPLSLPLGCSVMPNILGMLGPVMSASSIPTSVALTFEGDRCQPGDQLVTHPSFTTDDGDDTADFIQILWLTDLQN